MRLWCATKRSHVPENETPKWVVFRCLAFGWESEKWHAMVSQGISRKSNVCYKCWAFGFKVSCPVCEWRCVCARACVCVTIAQWSVPQLIGAVATSTSSVCKSNLGRIKKIEEMWYIPPCWALCVEKLCWEDRLASWPAHRRRQEEQHTWE